MSGGRFWTEQKVAILRRMWPQGRPVEAIRAATGARSDSAVTSKAYELGLKNRGVAPKRPGRGASPATSDAVERALAVVTRKGGIAEPKGISQGKSAAVPKAALKPFRAPPGRVLVDASALKPDQCQWPFGERPPFRYCGAAPQEGGPYCAEHRKIGTRPPTAAEKRLAAGAAGAKRKGGAHGKRA